MIQLGISAFFHDSAACIVKDGTVIAAAEEERFTEVKHDFSFPIQSIQFCLNKIGIEITEVDEVCWYEQPDVKYDRVQTIFKKRRLKTFFLNRKFKKEFAENNPQTLLNDLGYEGPISYVPHHKSHAAFSFYTSNFKDADILVVDGVGEWDTVSIWKGDSSGLKLRRSVKFPNSLGMFYSTMTSYLGFKPNEGEYKVMGLSPYGNPRRYFEKLNSIFEGKGTNFTINQKYFTWEYSDGVMFNEKFIKLLGLQPRLPEEELTQAYKDLASATQAVYEYHFLELVKEVREIGKSYNLALGGGCAYNGVANHKAHKYYTKVYIPYAPSDAGSAIGACLYQYKGPVQSNVSPYLGPKYSEEYIEGVLKNHADNVSFIKFSDEKLFPRVAKLINDQTIVAWFQNEMEFGARALGNRSILASPLRADMREKLNYVIKKREGFRPFAPSVLDEDVNKYFAVKEYLPYMNQVVKVKSGSRNLFPAATHIDGTARVQSVTEKANSRYYLLLQEVKKLSGHGVVLNTSFNLKDQTITRTPQQAIDRFINSKIDYLVLGNYLVIKK